MSSIFLARVLPSGVCVICFDDHVDGLFVTVHFYELSSELKPIFLLFLYSVSVMYSSFQCLYATPI
jgi:hypothetical protein